MAWGFWSASNITSNRGRSPRRDTVKKQEEPQQVQQIIQQSQQLQQQQSQQQQQLQQQQQQQLQQQQQQQLQQCSSMMSVNHCVQDLSSLVNVNQQQQSVVASTCGSPCQSPCHSPCQSGTMSSGTPEPQCQLSQCMEPECQYSQQIIQPFQQIQQQQLPLQQPMTYEDKHHQLPPHIHQIHYEYSRRTSLDSNAGINQLSDIICPGRPSIMSATNTLTRNSSFTAPDTGDYAIPHPHHAIMSTTKSTTSLIRCGSCPGSAGISRRGSSSESSPAGTIAGHSDGGGGTGNGSGYSIRCDGGHYDRMPIAIPIGTNIHNDNSYMEKEEIEPAYATVFPNNIQLQGRQSYEEPPPPPPPQSLPYQEDRSIYRRGARRWRKLYRINGHIFQAKRFNRRAFCTFCHDRIFGLGKQGYKCIQCKLLVHKKCHKLVQRPCGKDYSDGITTDSGGEELNGNNECEMIQAPYTYQCDMSDCSQNYMSDQELVVETPIQKQYSLDDFELIKVIGRGSYAKVLMVELKKTKRIYAMKVIKKALVTDDEDIDWVQTEKHVFETASNHPFLVGLHSCFQTPSRLFFVIEFVRGGDLMFHMQRQRRLPEEHARFYAAEISLALNFLHEKGIIYRDLKLDNVLLDHEGHIKLTDYGMCKEGIGMGDTTSTFCGTPNYIAPEILRGEDYGFSVDWWALGVLLYEMLAGRSPFDVTGAETAEQTPSLCQSRKRRSIHSSSFLQNTEDFLFQVILEKTIRIPRSLSVKAASVLKGFLNKNPYERLGCNRESAFLDIINHQFFKTIDWEMLEQKQIQPPFQPRLGSERDLTNFPPEFTDEPVYLTPDDDRIIEKIDQSEFEGFEYVNPLLMTLDDCV